MSAKIISAAEAAALIPDGATVMFGGFLGCGSAHAVIAAIAARGVKDITMICNDAAMPGNPYGGEPYYGIAKLVHARCAKKFISTHVGKNPEVAAQMAEGSLELELVPQGSFVEMIRAAGAGLGGVLTPTGVGTLVEESAHVFGKIEIDGAQYLIERPLRADFAIIGGHTVDRRGNIWYKGSTRNFNTAMATAANVVIVEADHIVETGCIEPENVMTPGILVDYIVAAPRGDI